MRHIHAGTIVAVLLTLIGRADATEPPLPLVTEEFMVEAADPNISLYVRNKHPVDLTQVPPGRVLLFIHGATQPSEVTFDLSIGGKSWMDYIASLGWDVYLMDFRGYGGSTRSPELARPDATDAPAVSTLMKVRDVAAVVDVILERRGASKINLLAWSMGATSLPPMPRAIQRKSAAWFSMRRSGVTDLASLIRPAQAESAIQDPGSGPILELAISGVRDRLQSGVAYGRREELFPPDSRGMVCGRHGH